MKASKLIEQLQSQLNLYGDLDVVVVDSQSQEHRIENVESLLFNIHIITK